MQQGVIRNSVDAFSRPMILVKKDNLWQMCMSYMAIIKVIVQDKYHISERMSY